MNTHHLQSEEAEEQVSFNMFNLIDLSEPRAEPITATLQINGKELEMEVHTGPQHQSSYIPQLVALGGGACTQRG